MGQIDDFGSAGELVTSVQLIDAQTQFFRTPYIHICAEQALEPSKH